ncbi:hypothetical protein PALB_9140 [Pseudoalteromonas luteoviolacea B = ATCC 29581]|nr:hypothetical protein PALB_9140 [Pseudoalteromonas luteoviolacea B = ATCC 29581]
MTIKTSTPSTMLRVIKLLQWGLLIATLTLVGFIAKGYWQPLLVSLVIVNVFGIGLYWVDKRRSQTEGASRISEIRLILVGVMGLHIASFLGRYWFRHKTLSMGFNTKLLLSQVILFFLVWLTNFR